MMTLALLQNMLQELMKPELIWVLIPLAGTSLVALAILLDGVRELIRKSERSAARKMYERLVLEKLDVIKTAVAMGFPRNDLAELDSQLERLIGQEQMQKLLDKKAPGLLLPSQELLDTEGIIAKAGLRERDK